MKGIFELFKREIRDGEAQIIITEDKEIVRYTAADDTRELTIKFDVTGKLQEFSRLCQEICEFTPFLFLIEDGEDEYIFSFMKEIRGADSYYIYYSVEAEFCGRSILKLFSDILSEGHNGPSD